MEFKLLGPLTVRIDGRDCTVAAAKQRIVLATLLLSPNQTWPLASAPEAPQIA